MEVVIIGRYAVRLNIRIYSLTQLYKYYGLATCFDAYLDRHKVIVYNLKNKDKRRHKNSYLRGLLEKYPTFGREKETGLLGALDT